MSSFFERPKRSVVFFPFKRYTFSGFFGPRDAELLVNLFRKAGK